jgi:hypothetical protein
VFCLFLQFNLARLGETESRRLYVGLRRTLRAGAARLDLFALQELHAHFLVALPNDFAIQHGGRFSNQAQLKLIWQVVTIVGLTGNCARQCAWRGSGAMRGSHSKRANKRPLSRPRKCRLPPHRLYIGPQFHRIALQICTTSPTIVSNNGNTY